MSLGRVLRWLFASLVVAAAVLWPLVFGGSSEGGPVADPVVITDYQARFDVDAEGNLQATETITAVFPGGRHGIFRYWDVANPNSPGVRQRPEIASITQDGVPARYQLLWQDDGRFRVAKIGDPGRYLDPGLHVYEIRYRIDGVLDPGSSGAGRTFATERGDPDARTVFYWNVIAPAWNNRIERADIVVSMPAEVTGAQCAVGQGSGWACSAVAVSGDTVTVSARELPPRTPVTVRVGADVPTPPRAELPWSFGWDAVLGQSRAGVVWVAVLTAVGIAVATSLNRLTFERAPGFPLQYAPPQWVGPVQFEYIRTEDVPGSGVTATLFYLAERGLIELEQTGDKKWIIRGQGRAGDWDSIDPVSVAVAKALKVDTPGSVFRANGSISAGKKLTTAKTEMDTAVRNWALDYGLLVKRRGEWWVRVANLLALVWAIMATIRWGFPATVWVVPFAVYFFLSARSWRAGVGTRRTAQGRELWSRVGGFHRLLATDSAEDRFDFGARRELYTAYVPFAVACGSAALWAQKYQAATGMPAPQPDWYHSRSTDSGHGFTAGPGGSGFDSFESALSSSIGAYTASQRSSSSSSGSSGGGGGSLIPILRCRRYPLYT
ncbi:DUF2207 domain-containing protein, partial [Mycolicibacterium palauense]|uniref:DUF2207 domain-containing protein n=1 Tax=Mycolicibacterium palauense TaxID=2034511 RepID=UPI000BFEEB94